MCSAFGARHQAPGRLLLNNVSVCAFDFARTDGQASRQRILVIELLRSMAQIAVALTHWCVAIGNLGGFKNAVVRHQFVHHLGERHVCTKVGDHAL